jgi:hypothetical protein
LPPPYPHHTGPSTYSNVSCFPIFSFHVTPFKKILKTNIQKEKNEKLVSVFFCVLIVEEMHIENG